MPTPTVLFKCALLEIKITNLKDNRKPRKVSIKEREKLLPAFHVL